MTAKGLAFAYAVLSFSDFGPKGPFAIGRAKTANQADQASRETSAAYDAHLFEKVATVGQYPEKLKEFRTN